MLRPLHPSVAEEESWRAIVGVFGDLGPSEAKWGTPPWPAELGPVVKKLGSKNFADAVAGINAPRRTAEYDGELLYQLLWIRQLSLDWSDCRSGFL